jgi:LacI family transcriptional regulator
VAAKEALGLLVQRIASGADGAAEGRDVILDHEIIVRQSSAPPA